MFFRFFHYFFQRYLFLFRDSTAIVIFRRYGKDFIAALAYLDPDSPVDSVHFLDLAAQFLSANFLYTGADARGFMENNIKKSISLLPVRKHREQDRRPSFLHDDG